MGLTVPPMMEQAPDDAPMDVIAAMAHEVRTPITSLRATIDVLIADQDELSREETTEMLRRLQRGTVWLQEFFENLISTMSLDTHKLKLARRPVVIADCIEQVLPLAEPLMDRKRQRLRVSGAVDAVLDVDPQRIVQVLVNLLVNASKYSVPGDVIDLTVRESGPFVEIRVTDHGPGVELDEREAIFERYVRGSNCGSTSGVGLGLSVVRALVALHGGTAEVESEPGKGASFVVRLPAPERRTATPLS